ncbi:MAG: hypothetical protein ABI767_11810 [Rhodanobacter sp.]
MKTQNLIASAAAILFTVASLSAVNYNVTPTQASVRTQTIDVVDLAPVYVHATPEERRNASLTADIGTSSFASIPAASRIDEGSHAGQFSLLGSEMAMPYYSFSNKFGRITKE